MSWKWINMPPTVPKAKEAPLSFTCALLFSSYFILSLTLFTFLFSFCIILKWKTQQSPPHVLSVMETQWSSPVVIMNVIKSPVAQAQWQKLPSVHVLLSIVSYSKKWPQLRLGVLTDMFLTKLLHFSHWFWLWKFSNSQHQSDVVQASFYDFHPHTLTQCLSKWKQTSVTQFLWMQGFVLRVTCCEIYSKIFFFIDFFFIRLAVWIIGDWKCYLCYIIVSSDQCIVLGIISLQISSSKFENLSEFK